MSKIIVILILLGSIFFVILERYQKYRTDLYTFFGINRSDVKSVYAHLLEKERSTFLSKFLGLDPRIKNGYIVYCTPYDKIKFKIIKSSFSEEEEAILQKLENFLKDRDYNKNKTLPIVYNLLFEIYCDGDAIPILQKLEINS